MPPHRDKSWCINMHLSYVAYGRIWITMMMMMMEVEEKIDAITQGEKSVHQYAPELRSLWVDLDHYDPFFFAESH
jgi:uncharacterized membrane protein